MLGRAQDASPVLPGVVGLSDLEPYALPTGRDALRAMVVDWVEARQEESAEAGVTPP
jgi:hypothetical protein